MLEALETGTAGVVLRTEDPSQVRWGSGFWVEDIRCRLKDIGFWLWRVWGGNDRFRSCSATVTTDCGNSIIMTGHRACLQAKYHWFCLCLHTIAGLKM